MAKWYMTVGYPGGECAVQLAVEPEGDYGFQYPGTPPVRGYTGVTATDFPMRWRPCPPDLAEWLNAAPASWRGVREGAGRIKVPGGWLYTVYEPPCKEGDLFPTTFVPVAGAAGITILEDTNGG